MNNSSFEIILKKKGRLIYSNQGDSMWPLIRQGSDLLIIGPVDGKLKKYDVPLYRRDNGQYVMHRVLKVREKDYVLCGDNRWCIETGITDRNIKGVLTGLIRGGKGFHLNSWQYHLYVHIWCDLFPLRALFLKCCNYVKKYLTN